MGSQRVKQPSTSMISQERILNLAANVAERPDPANIFAAPPKGDITGVVRQELATPRNFSWAEYAFLPWGELPSSLFGLEDLQLPLLLSKG